VKMKKILIADDHSAIRIGIKHILHSEFANIEIGEAVDGNDVFKKLKDKAWDIIILDINLPGQNGLEILKQLKDEKIGIPVLVFSMYREEQISVRAIKAGAAGYLPKDAADKELVKAVRQILSGRKYITDSVAELIANELENPDNIAPHQRLSGREYQAMLLIASGKTVSEIAKELSLSISTVSTYRARILEKMQLRTTSALVRYAVTNKLI
jgi:two-component system, NarL family, invasion response regulator UvrY